MHYALGCPYQCVDVTTLIEFEGILILLHFALYYTVLYLPPRHSCQDMRIAGLYERDPRP